jgi:fused signal recognition particle receptor
MNIFKRLGEGLKKTRENLSRRLSALFAGKTLSDEFYDNLEEILITGDIGMEMSVRITESLRRRVREKAIKDTSEAQEELINIITEFLMPEYSADGDIEGDTDLPQNTAMQVILVIGVNGAGKTTTIGKLAARYAEDGKNVIVAAADTFRAAAIEQLTIWAERAGAKVVSRPEGSDPASVVYDALDTAKARNADVLIIDTAGRLHNKKHLMDELAKIRRIIAEKTDTNTETLLVLDATTGQNAVSQAKLFNETCGVTGIVLTKLDGTAKGGIIIPIAAELKIPVKWVGVGEKIGDLTEFNPREFIEAIFSNANDFDYNYERLDNENDNDSDEQPGETP